MNRYRIFFRSSLAITLSLVMAALLTGSAAADTDSYLGVAFHPFTLDGDNGTCIEYYDNDLEQMTRNCDPVNLVFPGRTWLEVRDWLVDDGWDTCCEGTGQSLHYDDELGLYPENEQLVKPGTYFNPRYHIRLWQAPGSPAMTLAAVHHEITEGFTHKIDIDWELAEAYVASSLCAPDCEQTGPLATQIAIQGDDTWRVSNDGADLINNGSATVIPTPEPPAVAIIQPTAGSTVSGVTPVQIAASDNYDLPGALTVEWRIDSGSWSTTIYNAASGYFEANWDPASVPDGDHLFYARVIDSAQTTATDSHTVTVDKSNDPPSAAFTFACNDLSCSFDGSDSVDADGTIDAYAWDFGDLNSGSGMTTNHTYGATGTYSVTLTVTDNEGASGAHSESVTVVAPSLATVHVGDMEGTSVAKRTWRAEVTITIHDNNEALVAGAIVSGAWSGDASGLSECVTGSDGNCFVSSAELSKKIADHAIFTVTNVEHAELTYDGDANHDPQGNSSGTAIQVNKDGTTLNPGDPLPQPPVASFTFDCTDLTCDFNAAGSHDPDGGDIDTYDWDLGDGTLIPDGGVTINYSYASAGSRQVTLTVTDDEGESDSQTQTVTTGEGAAINLTAVGYKVRAIQHVDLTWDGISSGNLDIYRDNVRIAESWPVAEVPYTDNLGQKRGGPYEYWVCVADSTTVCSDVVVVEF